MNDAFIVKQMKPLGLEANNTLTPQTFSDEEEGYFRRYGIDFENQLEGVNHRFGYLDSSGFRIACHQYAQPQAKGTVFLLHGYYDHAGLFRHILHYFLHQGFNAVIYDLPGHGLSSGGRATIDDFSLYRTVLEDVLMQSETQLTKPWYGFGQSTGAAILTDCLNHRSSQGQPLPFEQVILSAPLVRPCGWKLSRLKLYLLKPFIRTTPRHFTHNSRDKAFIKLAHNDPLAPKVLTSQWVSALDRWIRKIEASPHRIPISPLIIQGTQDRTVDAEHNMSVLERLYKSPRVLWLDGARHHLPNELLEAREQYLGWLSSELNVSSSSHSQRVP